MVSLQEDTLHESESPGDNNSLTGGTYPKPGSPQENTLLDSGDSSELSDIEHDMTYTNAALNHLSSHAGFAERTSCLPQTIMYPPKNGNTYASQAPVLWANTGSGIGRNNMNYGLGRNNMNYYRPSAMYYGGYGDSFPNAVRTLHGTDLPTPSMSVPKLWYGEQQNNLSPSPMDIHCSSRNPDMDSKVHSLHNIHASMQSYFPSDELHHQAVNYPRLTYQQNFPSIACRFPPQIMSSQPTGPQIPTSSSTQSTAPPTYFQHQVMQEDVPVHYPDVLPGVFSQPSTQYCEFQSNPLAACEAIQSAADQRFLSSCFHESNEANLRKLSDICATSSPLHGIPDQESIYGNFEKDLLGNNAYTRITLGHVMNPEGLRYGPNGSPSSCMFLRRGEILRNYALSFSEKSRNLSATNGKPLNTANEVDVVGVDSAKKAPDQMANVEKVSPTKRTVSREPTRGTSTGQRDCECKVCGKKLARMSTLKIHMRQHTGVRPFKCVTCEKTFAQAGLLQSHSRTHTGERPYTCSHCRKKFSHSGALKTHLRTHTGERPHKCRVPGCNLAFGDSSTLSKHARTHTGERPYVCDICGKRFTQSGNMHKHRKGVHKVHNASSRKESTMPLKEKIPESIEALLLASESSTPQRQNSPKSS